MDIPANSGHNDVAIEIIPQPHGQDTAPADKPNEGGDANPHPDIRIDNKPYSVFTHNEKKIIIICVGLAQFFLPISGQIYFPLLDTIASDLHVSNSLSS